MDEETKERIKGMPREQQRARFDALRRKLGMSEPASIAGGKRPLEASMEEHEEYQFLKTLLGHSEA